MEFKVNSGIWGTMFGVPAIVADNFLKLASSEQIKVLLYVLRHSGNICSDEDIAMNTGVNPAQVNDALLFWQQVNVLSPQGGTAFASSPLIQPVSTTAVQPVLTPQPVSVPAAQVTPAVHNTSPTQNEAPLETKASKRHNYSGTEISAIMKDSNDISELLKTAESMLGPLRNGMMNSLIWMYDFLGLKKEVILTLTSYCVQTDRASTQYIEKIACSWAENDINSLTQAQEEIQKLSSANDFTEKILKLFEMNRRPSSKEREFIESWKNAGFSSELIHLAYEKTIEQINKLSFAYINRILESWKESGYFSVKEVKDAESAFRSKKDKQSNTAVNDPELDKYKQFINKF